MKVSATMATSANGPEARGVRTPVSGAISSYEKTSFALNQRVHERARSLNHPPGRISP